MGKFLRKFDNHSAYEAAESGLILPNVSFCVSEMDVHYNPSSPTPQTPNNIIKYAAPSKLSETTSDKTAGLHTNQFSGSSGQLTIESHTFENGVGTIEFNDDITAIGGYAFYYSSGMTAIDLPNSLVTIDDNNNYCGAFFSCKGLTSIDIPSGVTNIGTGAFMQCSGLTSVTIPNSVTRIGVNAFNSCSGLTSVTIPNSVETVDANAFSLCTGLVNCVINGGAIGTTAFQVCTSLTACTIGSGVTSIGLSAFTGCSVLTTVYIDNGVTSIGDYAFKNCSGITSIDIPNSVTNIGSYALGWCSGLTSITVEATTPPTLGNYSFANTNNCPIYVPSGSVDAYKAATNWKTYASRIQAIPSE